MCIFSLMVLVMMIIQDKDTKWNTFNRGNHKMSDA